MSRGVTWSDAETKKLVQMWCQAGIQQMISRNERNADIFKMIAEKLEAQGVVRDPECCLKKIQTLKRVYRKFRDELKKTGGSGDQVPPRPLFHVYDLLNQVLESKPLTSPQLIEVMPGKDYCDKDQPEIDDSMNSSSTSSLSMSSSGGGRKRAYVSDSDSSSDVVKNKKVDLRKHIENVIKSSERAQEERLQKWMEFQEKQDEKDRAHQMAMIQLLLHGSMDSSGAGSHATGHVTSEDRDTSAATISGAIDNEACTPHRKGLVEKVDLEAAEFNYYCEAVQPDETRLFVANSESSNQRMVTLILDGNTELSEGQISRV